jgi:hypothetical protein
MNRTANKNNSRVRRADNKARANDGKRIRNILIFDNHPDSLRLLREIYSDSPGPTLSQYCLLIIALVLLGLAVVIVWFT